MTGRHTVMFCCNHWKNGNFLGRVCKIDVQEYNLELECTSERGPKIDFKPFEGRIVAVQVSRRVFPIWNYISWYGNWCWDAVTMDRATMNDLLRWLRNSGKWNCIGGRMHIGNWWERGTEGR